MKYQQNSKYISKEKIKTPVSISSSSESSTNFGEIEPRKCRERRTTKMFIDLNQIRSHSNKKYRKSLKTAVKLI